jgi:hypothetical protein
MIPRQSFGVAVRIVGLIIFIYGLYVGFYTALDIAGIRTRIQEPLATGAIFSVFWLIIGLILLFAADAIADLAYRKDRN